MAVIGELAVNVVARTDKLEKGIKSARKQMSGLSKGFQNATRHVTGFTSAILGGFGIYAVARGLGNAAESIDKLAKTSQKLGIATEELAGLHVAAERTGVPINQLEMGLQRLVRRVSEAGQGTGEAKDAIAELGLNARNLASLAPEKQFSAIAGAMSHVTDQSDKVRLAFKLFDSEGVNLIRTLDLGEKGLKGYREEAERLGLAVSAEEAAKVEKYNDALGRLSDLKGGIGKAIIIKLAPGLEGLLEGIEQMIAPKKHEDKLGPTLTGVKREGFLRPLGRALESTQRWGTNLPAPARTDIRTEGVPLRPGEVMDSKKARELVTVNQEQLRLQRQQIAKQDAYYQKMLAESQVMTSDPFGNTIEPVTIP